MTAPGPSGATWCGYRLPAAREGPSETTSAAEQEMPAALDAIIAELSESDRQERIDLLIDFAKNLAPLPERLAALKDASHRVEECQSPVYLFVEMKGDRVSLHADA